MNYVLGLDVGIASVGWAVLELNEEDNPIRIEGLGARILIRQKCQRQAPHWQHHGE